MDDRMVMRSKINSDCWLCKPHIDRLTTERVYLEKELADLRERNKELEEKEAMSGHDWGQPTINGLEQELADLRKKYNHLLGETIGLKQELAELKQKYFDIFNQACQITTEKGEIKFDHMCISSYEEAQDYLIEQGLLKPEDCYRS